jgi:hypothetical protein
VRTWRSNNREGDTGHGESAPYIDHIRASLITRDGIVNHHSNQMRSLMIGVRTDDREMARQGGNARRKRWFRGVIDVSRDADMNVSSRATGRMKMEGPRPRRSTTGRGDDP